MFETLLKDQFRIFQDCEGIFRRDLEGILPDFWDNVTNLGQFMLKKLSKDRFRILWNKYQDLSGFRTGILFFIRIFGICSDFTTGVFWLGNSFLLQLENISEGSIQDSFRILFLGFFYRDFLRFFWDLPRFYDRRFFIGEFIPAPTEKDRFRIVKDPCRILGCRRLGSHQRVEEVRK